MELIVEVLPTPQSLNEISHMTRILVLIIGQIISDSYTEKKEIRNSLTTSHGTQNALKPILLSITMKFIIVLDVIYVCVYLCIIFHICCSNVINNNHEEGSLCLIVIPSVFRSCECSQSLPAAACQGGE